MKHKPQEVCVGEGEREADLCVSVGVSCLDQQHLLLLHLPNILLLKTS